MHRLKIELMALSRELGDTGSDEFISNTTDQFINAMTNLFTPLAMETIKAVYFRNLYHWMVATTVETGECPELWEFAKRIGLLNLSFPDLPVNEPLPAGGKVFRLH